jgi:hypothetical protein
MVGTMWNANAMQRQDATILKWAWNRQIEIFKKPIYKINNFVNIPNNHIKVHEKPTQ